MAQSTVHHGGPLNFQAGPLVWIDCEMTGLNPKHDKLLEIAVSQCFYSSKRSVNGGTKISFIVGDYYQW